MTDIVYILRKTLATNELKDTMRDLLDLIPLIDLTALDCREGLELDMGDYEDALQIRCALAHGCEYLVTRDSTLLKRTVDGLHIVTPRDLLTQLTPQ